MDEKLSDLLVELKEAINDALLHSERVAKAMAALEREGRDVQIAIDAALIEGEVPTEGSPATADRSADSMGQLTLNWSDIVFLHKLKISIEATVGERL